MPQLFFLSPANRVSFLSDCRTSARVKWCKRIGILVVVVVVVVVIVVVVAVVVVGIIVVLIVVVAQMSQNART